MADHFPRRIACLQPSASLIVAQLGLADRVVACTRHCAELCPDVMAVNPLVVEDSWSAQAAEIVASKPDLVIAAVPYQLEALGEILKAGVRSLTLAPHGLGDVYSDICTVGGALGRPREAEELVSKMQSVLEHLRSRTAALARPTVYCEEWGKPIIHAQPWVQELVEAAGGQFVGEAGKQTTADAVSRANPDVMVFGWCGVGDRVPLEKVVEERGWRGLAAVRSKRVYCIHDALLTTPATNLADAAQILASVIHPEVFTTERPPRRIS